MAVGPRRARTTSACAENTLGFIGDDGVYRNYLRVRGEYSTSCLNMAIARELPPRARRILFDADWVATIEGTTSACAENTDLGMANRGFEGNYLRVRGEYSSRNSNSQLNLELPPRARRILSCTRWISPLGGTTSACAENTHL